MSWSDRFPLRGWPAWAAAAVLTVVGIGVLAAWANVPALAPSINTPLLPAILLMPLIVGTLPTIAGLVVLLGVRFWLGGDYDDLVTVSILVIGATLAATLTGLMGRAIRHAREATIEAEIATRAADEKAAEADALRKLAESHAAETEMLKGELQHRVRNLLSVVGAMAGASFRHGGDPQDNLRRFRGRLDAHIRAHDLVFDAGTRPIEAQRLARTILDPFPTDRLSLEGDRVRIEASLAAMTGLALHELATNAQKHGAWSVPEGRVTLRMEGDAEGLKRIEWIERGGPAPQAAPDRQGFGSKLLGTMLSRTLSGRIDARFEPEGLTWTFDADPPADAAAPQAPEAPLDRAAS